MPILRLYFSNILNIIFPPACYICRKKNTSLCDSCLKNFAKSFDNPFIYSDSVYSFKDLNIKRIIHAIKYYHRSDLVEPITRELTKLLMDSKYNTQEIKWCIVPIPMPKIRKYIRGYNQAELIAKELSQKTSIPIKNNVLTRTYSPKRQVKSHTRNERLKNQHNSFQTTSSVNGLNIILVDDVITTGATIFEARNILQKSGANKVVAISLAH